MRKRFFLNCLLMLTLVLVMSTSAFAISESDVESAGPVKIYAQIYLQAPAE